MTKHTAQRVEKRKCLCTASGDVGTATREDSTEAPQKIKIEISYDLINPISGYTSKGNKISILKRYLYPCVYCSIIHNSQNVEIILPLTN